jgi:formylglycine-generating enzyme required for sulfatase activity
LACLVAAPAGAAGITYQEVTVGNAGNAGDTTGYGAVAYDYQIGAYDVTIGQYTACLNAVSKTDTYSLYNSSMGTNGNIAGISQSGSSGNYSYSVIGSADRPITYVNWFDAARFANWMANGQPTGAQTDTTTENGAYALSGADNGGLAPAKNATNVQRWG